ncbi:ubiquitin 3 binding protein But2 C-terminal domain-containing protein [Aspergillus spectabilis]
MSRIILTLQPTLASPVSFGQLLRMRNFATIAAFAAGAHALVPRDTTCCFHITASGEASGPIGQLGDGQNRIGGDLPEAQFCIDSTGSITDGSGRGCILTPPTTQFQCDLGGTPTPGFSINSDGELQYNGATGFVACETGEDNELNLYTTESADVTNCRNVKLNADSCFGPGAGSSSVPGIPSSSAPIASSTVPVVSPSPSAPGSDGPGQGTSSVPVISPSSSAPGSEGPGQGTTTVPVVSPTGPGSEGPGQGTTTVPGSEGPGEGTTTIPGVIPTGPGSEGPGQGTATEPGVVPTGPGSDGCSECPATTTIYTTVTVPCGTETPGIPGGGESNTPGVPGGTEPGPGPSQPPSSETPPTQPSGSPSPGPSQAPSSEIPPTQPSQTIPPQTSQPPSSGTPPQPSGSQCPLDLSGDYEFPHLIIPVDSSTPDNAPGTSYNGTVSSTISSIFNFDIPASDAGKTCNLVFLFPKQEDLETSAFSFSGDGAVQFGALESAASQSTTYNNAPAVSQDLGTYTVAPGNSYSIGSFACPAGQTVSFVMTNAGSTELDFFEDYNPSP